MPLNQIYDPDKYCRYFMYMSNSEVCVFIFFTTLVMILDEVVSKLTPEPTITYWAAIEYVIVM